MELDTLLSLLNLVVTVGGAILVTAAAREVRQQLLARDEDDAVLRILSWPANKLMN